MSGRVGSFYPKKKWLPLLLASSLSERNQEGGSVGLAGRPGFTAGKMTLLSFSRGGRPSQSLAASSGRQVPVAWRVDPVNPLYEMTILSFSSRWPSIAATGIGRKDPVAWRIDPVNPLEKNDESVHFHAVAVDRSHW
ncbi:hypothetical protein PanWU01x14_209620 [Parasponia andersonii]|uniref:Uncharacterized protein n=1 Tax=Parasponia andersonii TaxID=3476 RepID=A0A2P5BU93_PARAD|nr:hypothetical protein PanWU01x14_209620 [Parasponia andersonii]